MSDASDHTAGAALQQRINDDWQPLAFFSRKLNTAERKYGAYDRELLAIYLAVKHFKHMIEGRSFIIYTDHKPLIFAFRKKPDKCTPRQFRHLDFIAQCSTDIRHVQGRDNIVADTLSRIEELSTAIDYEALAKAQAEDRELKEYLDKESPLQLKQVQIPETSAKVFCDVSTTIARPFVTTAFRRAAFSTVHQLSHPGIKATVKLVTQRFVWPSVKKDCREWARACMQCQRSKISRHVSAPIGTFIPPTARFEHVHIDLVGPLPISRGFRYCLTCVDRFTRWPEAFPIENIEATTVARAFFAGWIARFGTPLRITTDQGRQFESQLFRELGFLLGSTHLRTTAYHPAANGLVERFHRQMKAAIKCHESERWTETLPAVLLGIRSAWREDISSTAAELVYGEPLRLPGEFLTAHMIPEDATSFVKDLKQYFGTLRPKDCTRHGDRRTFVFKDLATTTHVFVRYDAVKGPLQQPYEGPFEVVKRTPKTFVVWMRGKDINVSIDRLKPAYVIQENTETYEDRPEPTYRGEQQKSAVDLPKTTRVTRSGRQVRFPDRLQGGFP